MSGSEVEGPGLGGAVRLTWVSDHLAHVLEHSRADEPTGTWTNPRELHQAGALALVAWPTRFCNGCRWLAAGAV
jgi:hypothetical protein